MIAYGARCVWWDDKENVAAKPSGLPCCPHCGGVLFEIDESLWWQQVDAYENGTGGPGYRRMLEWSRGKCFPNIETLREAFNADS